jgi:hypothetical protein
MAGQVIKEEFPTWQQEGSSPSGGIEQIHTERSGQMEKVMFDGKQIELHSQQEALDLAVEVIEQHWTGWTHDEAISGFGYLSFEVERAYGVGARIEVGFTNMRIEDSDAVRIRLADPKVEVNWSGKNRDVAEATASIALYQEMVALAALIDCRLAELRFIGKVLEHKGEES